MRTLAIAMMLWGLISLAWGQAAAPLGLYVGPDGVLMHGGEPFRAFGVNYITVFTDALEKPGDTSYEDGLRALAAHGIPVARIFGAPFWPAQMKIYFDDRRRYYEVFDAVVAAAERHGVGLIPSLFWNMHMVPDLVGEPCDQWGNPDSKTHAFMREYVHEVVTRYLDSPALWGWEFGNEYNLAADLPNAAEHRPPIIPALGTPTTRSERDELTHEIVRTAIREFAEEVRKYDPRRIISSGNGFPRPSAWHQMHELSWTQDTPEQYAEMLLGDNPGPVDVLSVHAYEDYRRLELTMEIARRARKPLFVGEFGVPGADEETRAKFSDMLSYMENLGVPLACLWVYNYPGQDDTWNVTADNARSYMLAALGEVNKRLRGEP
ncbi:MAG: glycoside hydrolase family 5 protein [Armatimonadetes bacterium]|nr:glycoside hydrolase family 5 protein [Armatimonadota bacterium]